jgi:hypothetical protein
MKATIRQKYLKYRFRDVSSEKRKTGNETTMMRFRLTRERGPHRSRYDHETEIATA